MMRYPGTWADRKPTSPAILIAETGVVRTYRELDERSNQVAHFLRDLGLTRGDHIAIMSHNCAEFLEIAWAAQRSGLFYTPINWHLTVDEAEYIVGDCGAKALFFGLHHADLAARFAGKAALVVIDAASAGDVDAVAYVEILDSQPVTRIGDESVGADMIYSSGTTGRPKGGAHRLPRDITGSRPDRLSQVLAEYNVDSDTVFLTPGAPLYHAAPLRWSMGIHRFGGLNVIMEKFDATTALEMVERYRVTHSQWVPTMFLRMLKLPEDFRRGVDVSSMRFAIHSAAPCPVSVKRAMIDWWGPIIYEYYGASEGGLLTNIGPQEWLSHPGSVGKAVWGVPHIVGDDGQEAKPGEIGTLYAEGGISIRYHNDPTKTAGAYDARGWSTVGDVGYLDEDGYLYLVDRRDDLIISGGVNIYPKEVEDILVAHPLVADAAVFGVPNDEFGQEVKAVVEVIDRDAVTDGFADDLLAYCREYLAAFKCPRSVDLIDELPRTSAGKLYKRLLRERYVPSIAERP